jgi:acetyl-CoA acetyltransferase
MTIDRQCSSGLMAVATAAKQIVMDGAPIVVAGGMESISLVQNEHMNMYRAADPAVLETEPHMYMPMIDTAEVVAERYGIPPGCVRRIRAAVPAASRRGTGQRPLRSRDHRSDG